MACVERFPYKSDPRIQIHGCRLSKRCHVDDSQPLAATQLVSCLDAAHFAAETHVEQCNSRAQLPSEPDRLTPGTGGTYDGSAHALDDQAQVGRDDLVALDDQNGWPLYYDPSIVAVSAEIG